MSFRILRLRAAVPGGATFEAREHMAIKSGSNAQGCAKCGSVKVRVIGQSPTPPANYLQCDACGHISVVPRGAPAGK